MYSGPITADVCYQIIHRTVDHASTNPQTVETAGKVIRLNKGFGDMPIMVMSKACHLRGKKPSELVAIKEEDYEFGGYFIVNGIERCVRLLQVPRRNHPTAIQRNNFKNRGPTYTDLGVAMRCARVNDESSTITNTVHYLSTGTVTFKFSARKQEFLIPVILILRALSTSPNSTSSSSNIPSMGVSDQELYQRIIQGDEDNTFIRARAQLLLQDAQRFQGLHSPMECLAYLGSRFRLLSMKPDSTSDIQIGHFVIQRYIMVHLPRYGDKLECILLMIRKLYALAAGHCTVDNADSLQNQEILLPGHLITTFVKEKFDETIMNVRLGLLKELKSDFAKTLAALSDTKIMSRLIDRFANVANGGVGKKVQHLLSTGNIISSTGLDLMQTSGFTIVAERLNFLRYCSHFRSVHRGQFFTEMKTTTVRKLLPDQWGFLCPVHTPDGGPCGLLSHLALKCSIVSSSSPSPSSSSVNFMEGTMVDLDDVLISLGVTPYGTGGERGDGRAYPNHHHLVVCLDGRVIGGAPAKLCRSIAFHLRKLKTQEKPTIPATLEVALIPPGSS
jgi:DNA-directed RNA polymerase I subunit RPA2